MFTLQGPETKMGIKRELAVLVASALAGWIGSRFHLPHDQQVWLAGVIGAWLAHLLHVRWTDASSPAAPSAN